MNFFFNDTAANEIYNLSLTDGLPILEGEQGGGGRWFWLGVGQGVSEAQYNLGGLYSHGEGGLEVDKAEAARWYRLAADQGFPEAQFTLGGRYPPVEGGWEVDKAEAARCYRFGIGEAPF